MRQLRSTELTDYLRSIDCSELSAYQLAQIICNQFNPIVIDSDPVGWEVRSFFDENTATPGWEEWKKIESSWTRTVASQVAEFEFYISRGSGHYQLRPIYAFTKDQL